MLGTTDHGPMASPAVAPGQNKELTGAYALYPTMDRAQQLVAGAGFPN